MSTEAPPARALHALRPYLSKTDVNLTKLNKILSSTSGVDTSLLTLGYTLTFVHSFLSRRLDKQLTQFATSIAKNASEVLLPGETLIATIQPTADSRLARLTASTKALADLIADFRIFIRLWGLVGIYAWAKDTYYNPPTDALIKRITWLQVSVNAAYQFLENGAYLASKGVLQNWSEKKQTRWWVWSSRFWAAHVVLDFARLARMHVLRNKSRHELSGAAEEEKEAKIASEEEVRTWWKEFYVNAVYAPLTVHWSLEEGAVGEAWVGLLGAAAGVIGFRDLWRKTS